MKGSILKFLLHRIRGSNWLIGISFILPAFLFFLVFQFYPILDNFYVSLNEWSGTGPMNFVGLDNYEKLLFRDPIFWLSLQHNLIWVALGTPWEVFGGLLLAILLSRKIRGAKIFRNLFFYPIILSSVMVSIIWRWIYNPNWGLLNLLLSSVGLDSLTRVWLGNPNTALPAVIFIHNWQWTGFHMVLFLAAIAGIPEDLIKAAKVDGAYELQRLRYVILPMIKRIIVISIVLCVSGKMRIFDTVWITTWGGPYYNTEVIATHMVKVGFGMGSMGRKAFYGYGAAIANVMLILVMVAVIVQMKSLLRGEALEY